MKLSIITASFNQGRFLKKCLTSVLKQKGPFYIEHIILDNCSTDNTLTLLQEYRSNSQDVNVQIIIEPDNGQTEAINKGFSLATGDIICWLNTDEWYSENTITSIVRFFKEYPDVDVVFGDCNFVDQEGNLVKHKREHFYSESMLLFYGCFLPSCTTFIRRKVIDDGIFLNPEFKVTMDFDWYVRIAKAGYKFAHISETLANFTWHDSNISSTFVARRLIERRWVQDNNSGIPGPHFVRSFVYWFMRYLWIGIRIIRRRIG